MAYLCIAFLILVGALYASKTKCITNLLTVYCIYWSLIVFLANLELFGMIQVSWKPYFLILIGGIGYTIGYILSNNKRHIHFKIGSNFFNKEAHSYSIRYNLAYTVMAIVLVFYLYTFIKLIRLIQTGVAYSAIRTMMLHGGEANIDRFYSNLERLFSDYFAVPSIFICVPLAMLSLVRKKSKRSFVALVLLNLILYVICTGSRIILASMVVQLFYLMVIYKISIPKKTIRIIKRVITFALVAIVIITLMRRNDYWDRINYTVYQSYYSYACLCVPLFDTWIDIIDKNNYLTLGLASLKPLLSIPDVFLRQFGISNFEHYYYTIDILNATENYFWVFENKNYNAFVTMFFYFYLDFREIGVFLGSLLYGRFCGKKYKRVIDNKNLKNLLLFMLLLQGFVKMLVRWEFSINNYLIAFIICRFFLKPENLEPSNER